MELRREKGLQAQFWVFGGVVFLRLRGMERQDLELLGGG